MGFHTRGEMGGVWTPPIKLVDGIWFGIGRQWIGPATRFTSGYGHVKMRLPRTGGLRVERTDFVPGEARGVLVGLRLEGRGRQTVRLRMQTHSELMGIYPWGETKPHTQSTFNLPDSVGLHGRSLVFREQGSRATPRGTRSPRPRRTTGRPRSAAASGPGARVPAPRSAARRAP